MANVNDGIFTDKTKHQEENFLRHVMQQDMLNSMTMDLIKPGTGVPVNQLSGNSVVFQPSNAITHYFGEACGQLSGGSVGNTMTIGSVVPVSTASVPQRFFDNCYLGGITNPVNTQPRSASMLHDFLTADLSKCSLDQLMVYSAFLRLVMSEFKDYDLDVPEEFEKRYRIIGREIMRAIEQQIDQLEAEERELQKREEKREVLRQKREKLQQALA